MWTKRNILITGVAFVAMVAVFVATFDWDFDKEEDTNSVVVRTPRPSRPAVPVALNALPSGSQAPGHVDTEEPVAVTPEPPREVTYEEAETAYNERRYEDATELFTRYTERRSENPWGHYMLGLSAWKSKDFEASEAAFTRALELDSKHFKSYINLSRVLLDTSRPAEALSCIDSALVIDTESNPAYRLRGRAFHQLGQVEDAIAAYRRAIQLDDKDAWSMNNMALLFIEQESFEEALPALARAVQLRDDIAPFRNNLGMALENTGYVRAAEESYEAAVAIDDTNQKALANYERVSAVQVDSITEPIDLAAVAQGFIDEIATWAVAMEDCDHREVAEADDESLVINFAGENDEPVETSTADADSTEIDG